MPAQTDKRAMFLRWLWLVYLPLGLLAICLVLMVLDVIGGALLWLVGLLAAYCVVPMRLLLETKRKGLELPKPPGAAGRARGRARRGSSTSPARKISLPEGGPTGPAAGHPVSRGPRPRTAPQVSPQIRRRRAVAGVLGIGVLLGIGALLFIIGMGRASSGTLGLALIGLGGFLMLLSVTLPTFKIVDMILRAIGRLVRRNPPPNRGGRRPEPAD